MRFFSLKDLQRADSGFAGFAGGTQIQTGGATCGQLGREHLQAISCTVEEIA